MDWHAPGQTGALAWAIGYGRLGYPVLPGARFANRLHGMMKGSRYDLDGPGSADPRRITAWWLGDRYANVGLQAGRGFVVIDVDTHPGRPNGFESLEREDVDLSFLPSERTPSGHERHYFLGLPEGWEENPLRSRVWLPGVEVKALGSFVAVWPSARSYVSTDPRDAGEFLPVPYRRDPGWPRCLAELAGSEGLLERIRTAPPVRSSGGGSASLPGNGDRLPPTEEFMERGLGWFTGSRNVDCYRLAWRLWNTYGDENAVFKLAARCYDATPDVTDFPWREVVTTVRSAERGWRGAEDARSEAAENMRSRKQ
jgi:bifunctional DNA primase/polymerase-like protein